MDRAEWLQLAELAAAGLLLVAVILVWSSALELTKQVIHVADQLGAIYSQLRDWELIRANAPQVFDRRKHWPAPPAYPPDQERRGKREG